MANRERSKIRFSELIAKGENDRTSDGFCGVSVNGTLRAGNDPGWNQDVPFQQTNNLPTTKGGSGFRKTSGAQKTGPWRSGNRSGE